MYPDLGADLGLEQSVVVLRAVRWWSAFDPLFFSGGGDGGEAQFRDEDNSVVLIAPNRGSMIMNGNLQLTGVVRREQLQEETET